MKLKTNKISKRKLDALKKALSGNIGYVAQECNCSPSAVYSVLNGTYSNEKVLNKCIEIRDMLELRIKELI